MSNRRQSTPGQGGAPRTGAVVAHTTCHGIVDRRVAAPRPRDVGIIRIGRAGRPGQGTG